MEKVGMGATDKETGENMIHGQFTGGIRSGYNRRVDIHMVEKKKTAKPWGGYKMCSMLVL